MKNIYQVVDGQLYQQVIEEFDIIPDGWTEDLESLRPSINPEFSNPNKSEVDVLKEQLAKNEQELLKTQLAMAEMFEQMMTGKTDA